MLNKQDLAERVAEIRMTPRAMNYSLDGGSMQLWLEQACLTLFDLLEAEGLCVVPAEPTEAMVAVGQKEAERHAEWGFVDPDDMADAYKAMLGSVGDD